jgi:hypothetical protein
VGVDINGDQVFVFHAWMIWAEGLGKVLGLFLFQSLTIPL